MQRTSCLIVALTVLLSAGAGAAAQDCTAPNASIERVAVALSLSEELEGDQLIATFRGQLPVPVWRAETSAQWSIPLDGSPLQPVPLSSLALDRDGRGLSLSKTGWLFDQIQAPQPRREIVGARSLCVAVITYSGVKVWRARVASLIWVGPRQFRVLERETKLPVICEMNACPPKSTTAFESRWLTARDRLAMTFVFGRCAPRIEMRQINVEQTVSKEEIVDRMIKDNCVPRLEDVARIPNEIAAKPLPR